MLRFMSKLLNGLADWRQRERAYAELSALDDRSLRDIGIARSEIPYVLSHAAVAERPLAARRPANSNAERAA